MPPLVEAERAGSPDEYTGEGMEATKEFFRSVGN